MKTVVRSFVCGYKSEPGRCVAGNKDCNNYCNHDPSKPMPKEPKTYETIEYSEKDIWVDVIEDIAAWLPGEKYQTVYEFLIAKYSIKFKDQHK